MSGAYDVKALQARLGNLRDKRDQVERSLSSLRGPPRDQARGHSPSPPPRGRLASRLGGSPPRAPRGRLASRLGPAMAGGGMGSFRDSRGPPERGRGLMRRRSEDEEEESNGGKKRLKSAVSVPGKDDDDDKAPHREEEEEEAMDEGAGEKENKAADGDGWGDADEGATHGSSSSSNVKVEEGEEGERPAPLRSFRSQQEDELKAETRGEVQQIYKQAEVQQRNRRLFGALMGHLGKAKERIAKDEGGILAKQNSVLAAVVDKDQGQSEKIRQKLRESRFKARRTEERKRAEIVKEQRAVELELDLARFANSLIKCKGFLRTKAEPAVYFMPKQLSEAAKALLVQTQDDMQARIREREEEVKAAIKELEADFIKNWPVELPEGDDNSHHDGEESSSAKQNGGGKHEAEDDMQQDKAAAENGADEDEEDGKAEKGKEEEADEEKKEEEETAAMEDDEEEE